MHQIRYFLAVSRVLNFTRAAEECNVTQPSLTRAIQKLEDEFGGQLFHRERSLTHLTDLGKSVRPHLARTFEAAQSATRLAISMGRAEVAPVTLGVVDGIMDHPLELALVALSDALPGLSLDIRTGTSEALLDQAMQGDFDLVIAMLGDRMPERMDVWSLYDRTYAVFGAPHPDGPSPRIVWSDAAPALQAALALSEDASAVRCRTPDLTQARRLVRLGLGHAILPREVVTDGTAPLRMLAGHDSVVLCAVAGRKRGAAADALLRLVRGQVWSAVA